MLFIKHPFGVRILLDYSNEGLKYIVSLSQMDGERLQLVQ